MVKLEDKRNIGADFTTIIRDKPGAFSPLFSGSWSDEIANLKSTPLSSNCFHVHGLPEGNSVGEWSLNLALCHSTGTDELEYSQ